MSRGRPRIACRRIRRIGGSRPRIARSRTCRSVRGSRGTVRRRIRRTPPRTAGTARWRTCRIRGGSRRTGVFRIRRIVRRRRRRTCRGSPRIRWSSGFRCRWSSFVTLLCRRCFLDRTGRVGAGDTSDMQGRSVGSFPVWHPPRGARGGDAAAHGRSAFGVRDGRRLAWRRGGRDDGARPVGVPPVPVSWPGPRHACRVFAAGMVRRFRREGGDGGSHPPVADSVSRAPRGGARAAGWVAVTVRVRRPRDGGFLSRGLPASPHMVYDIYTVYRC